MLTDDYKNLLRQCMKTGNQITKEVAADNEMNMVKALLEYEGYKFDIKPKGNQYGYVITPKHE